MTVGYRKEFDDHSTYVVKDNGHLNIRTQQYAFQNAASQRESSLTQIRDIPGPGHYQYNTSSFKFNINKQAQPTVPRRDRLGNSLSPNPSHLNHGGGASGYLNMSIPTIPSRYIQPNLEIDENEAAELNFKGEFKRKFIERIFTEG